MVEAQSDETLEIPMSPDGAFHEADLTRGMEHMRPYVQVEQQLREGEDVSQQGNDVYGVPASIINPGRHPPNRPPNDLKRTDPFQFGSRLLEEGDDIFEFNAWDHVEVDDAFKQFAEEQYTRQRQDPVAEKDRTRINAQPEKPWNKFYGNHANNFFKNRKWLFQEFPVLAEATAAPQTLDDGTLVRKPVTILEIGAGAGNTAFPILAANRNPDLKLHALDFSSQAVKVMRNDPNYDTQFMQADVWDLGGAPAPADAQEDRVDEIKPSIPPNMQPGTVDIALLVFTMSALSPDQWEQAFINVWALLKPGGEVLFRDYGHGDLAQVRFKKGRWLGDNFYVRGDETRVYFFAEEELRNLWQTCGRTKADAKTETAPTQQNSFEIVNLGVDRRMLVNRKRKLKMYRCWMQGRFRKPAS